MSRTANATARPERPPMPSDSRGAVTYTGGGSSRPAQPVLLSTAMRPHSSIVAFVRLCAASGVGVYLGGSVAGLVAVVNGDAFAAGSRWLANLPGLAVFGAGVGAVAAWTTRRWLLPRLSRRLVAFTVTGIVSLPLFTAISQLRAIEAVGAPLALLGGAVTAAVYWRASRPSSGTGPAQYSRVGSR